MKAEREGVFLNTTLNTEHVNLATNCLYHLPRSRPAHKPACVITFVETAYRDALAAAGLGKSLDPGIVLSQIDSDVGDVAVGAAVLVEEDEVTPYELLARFQLEGCFSVLNTTHAGNPYPAVAVDPQGKAGTIRPSLFRDAPHL